MKREDYVDTNNESMPRVTIISVDFNFFLSD